MLKPLSYLLCLILPVSTCFFLASGPHDITGVLAWTIPFWVVLLTDWLSPQLKSEADAGLPDSFFDGILYVLALLQLANIGLMAQYVSEIPWQSSGDWLNGLVNLIVVRFLVGTSSGTSGIVVAHELIHRNQWSMQQLGRLLLCSVCYEHFVITHKQCHHVNLGMPSDIATARLGESFDDFWHRVYFGYFRYAWRSELDRLGISQHPFQLKLLKSRVLHGVAMELTLVVAISLMFGWLAAFMLLYQAFAAVRILEAVNYFQHWGLEDGRFGNSYGWVTNSWFSRHALIGLSNHIGHHENESRHFHEIAYSELGPKLPYGYFVMNLWVKLDNVAYQKMAMQALKHYHHSQRS